MVVCYKEVARKIQKQLIKFTFMIQTDANIYQITLQFLQFSFKMIERPQHSELSFLHGGVRYNFNSSRWAKFPLDIDQLNYNLPAIILKNSIFSLVPSSPLDGFMSLHSFHLISQKSKRWLQDEKGERPKNKHTFGLIEHQSQIYQFGGRKQNQYFNDLRAFSTYSDTWTLFPQKGDVPSPRMPLIFCSIEKQMIFLFGGKNQHNLLSDAYIFYEEKWEKVQSEDIEEVSYISQLKEMNYCVIGSKIYLFGGFDGEKFSNQLFTFTIKRQMKRYSIQKVSPSTHLIPTPRSSHGMVQISKNFIVVTGGRVQEKCLLDINVFDIEQNRWFSINPLNGPLQSYINFTLLSFKNLLYFYGGYKPHTKEINRSLISLTFSQYEVLKTQLCSQCVVRLQNQEKEQFHSPKKPFVSNGFLHNLALQMNFPYHAVGLIADVAKTLKASNFSVSISEAVNGLSFIKILFNGQSLTRQQFVSIISHSYMNDPIVLQISDKLKLGSQRLGKTLVFVTNDDEMMRVFMFSSDSLVTSLYDQLYAYYAYEERISDKWVSTYEGVMHHKFIINILKAYLKNPEQQFRAVDKHALFIFENNLILSVEKFYYTELVPVISDIQQCKNTKKIDFLYSAGFRLDRDPQVSLKSYLSLLHTTNPIPNITVNGNKISLDSENNIYLNELRNLLQANKISIIKQQTVKYKNLQFEVSLYKLIDEDQYIPELKGVLIYYQNRLINRQDCEFGNLFWEKFYKTKYRRAFPIWNKVGVINVLGGLQVKTTLKNFKINANYRKFISYLKKQTKVDWVKKDYTLVLEDDEEEKDEIKKRVKEE